MASNDTDAGFHNLPAEILETIFCQIPHGDLLLHVTRVCRGWHGIISPSRFMPYKKLYYAYKKSRGTQFRNAAMEIETLMRDPECFMDSVNMCFVGFIERIRNFVPESLDGSYPRIKEVVEKMPLYKDVEHLFNEQEALKGCLETSTSSVPNSICAIAAMLVVAQEVDDASALLRQLLAGSGIPLPLILELFYAAATFFLAFHRRLKIPDKHHYIVFSAIYFFENKMQADLGTLEQLFNRQQNGVEENDSMREHKNRLLSSERFRRLTHEQFRIISNDIHDGDVIKINAFAGTGKTTTLIYYTDVRPQLKFLYIAYNKAIRLDAEQRFPKNVTCKTIHSIAWNSVGRSFSIRNKLGTLKKDTAVNVLGHMKGFDSYLRATVAIKTVDAFVASDDAEIDLSHVPTSLNRGPIRDENLVQHFADANVLWKKMKNVNDADVPMTYDGYLKLFQLRPDPNCDFSKILSTKFDVILVDEAQDMTPACIDILTRQRPPMILVGDPSQQIYCFRGAVNAMSLINGSSIHYLTQSFRFGPQIAHLCDTLLSGMKYITDRTIIGNPNNCTTLGEVDGQLCIISRTNFYQFIEAVNAVSYKSTAYWETRNGAGDSSNRKRPRIAFTGQDDKSNFFNQLLDINRLSIGKHQEIRDNFIKRFESFKKLQHYADKVEDHEIIGKCKIVEKYRDSVPQHINEIRLHMTPDLENADIVFSTAHKAKGLEFDTVKLTDDYLQAYNDFGLDGCEEDEKNILYVAVSRAKKSLIMNETLVEVLWSFGEPLSILRSNPNHVLPELSSSTITSSRTPPSQSTKPRCLVSFTNPISYECGRPIPPENSWIVKRPQISIRLPYEEETNNNTVRDGSFCRFHSFMVMPSFIRFLKTPRNKPTPEPKKKLYFSAQNLLNPPEEPAADDAADEEDVEYDKIMFKHFYPAFGSSSHPGVMQDFWEMLGLAP